VRIVLKGTTDRQLFAALINLRLKHINTSEGAIIGDEGVVLVTDKDVQKALDVLRQLGFSAQTG
jgi:hypothetical protein